MSLSSKLHELVANIAFETEFETSNLKTLAAFAKTVSNITINQLFVTSAIIGFT